MSPIVKVSPVSRLPNEVQLPSLAVAVIEISSVTEIAIDPEDPTIIYTVYCPYDEICSLHIFHVSAEDSKKIKDFLKRGGRFTLNWASKEKRFYLSTKNIEQKNLDKPREYYDDYDDFCDDYDKEARFYKKSCKSVLKKH